MYLNTISPAKNSKHSLKRRGRGISSGLGKTGGRGHKGQKSRSGGYIRRGFEGGQTPIYRRLPKFGFTSYKSRYTEEIRISSLKYIKNNIIDINSLKKANIIGKKIKFAKIILSGEINYAVTIRGLRVSKGARSLIESSGGKIEE